MPVHLDRQSDHPIGQRFRKKHNALSVSTVLSALSCIWEPGFAAML